VRVLCVGTSHRTAPLAVRERLAIPAGAVPDALGDLQRRWPEAELLLLNTCNRSELYTARALHAHPREEELAGWLCERAGVRQADCQAALYTHADARAVQHLFEVAAGLDSLVPGEDQIVAQVKDALDSARQAGSAGARLAELVSTALHVAKHVRTETALGEGKVSIASVAVDRLAEHLGGLAGKRVLCIGAGKVGRLLLRQLCGRNSGEVLVTNRSPEPSAELARVLPVRAEPFDRLADLLVEADAVVTSTGSADPILTAATLRDALVARDGRPLPAIDLAVPRDVDPAAGALAGLTLVNLDDLEATVSRTLRERGEHFHAARAIAAEHVAEFLEAAHIRSVAPTVEALYQRVEQIILDELAEAENKLSTHDDAAEDLTILRRTLRRALRRFCHPATEQLRHEAAAGHGQAHAETLRKLFDLDGEE
jgi:glutamyl-tRNA reductase